MSFTPDWVDALAFRGRFVFTLDDAAHGADPRVDTRDLADLHDEITPDDMGAVVAMPPATSDAQRLGFLLERLGAGPGVTSPLAGCLKTRSTTFVPLDPATERTGPRDSRWRVIENVEIEPD